jgi:hypothetical protein
MKCECHYPKGESGSGGWGVTQNSFTSQNMGAIGVKLPALTCFLSPRRGHTYPIIRSIHGGSIRAVNAIFPS